MSHARAMLEPCLTPFSFSFNGGFSSTMRSSVLHTDLLSRTNVNSQFFASISSCSKVGATRPLSGGYLMGGK